jgi:hypothetical protein
MKKKLAIFLVFLLLFSFNTAVFADNGLTGEPDPELVSPDGVEADGCRKSELNVNPSSILEGETTRKI